MEGRYYTSEIIRDCASSYSALDEHSSFDEALFNGPKEKKEEHENWQPARPTKSGPQEGVQSTENERNVGNHHGDRTERPEEHNRVTKKPAGPKGSGN